MKENINEAKQIQLGCYTLEIGIKLKIKATISYFKKDPDRK